MPSLTSLIDTHTHIYIYIHKQNTCAEVLVNDSQLDTDWSLLVTDTFLCESKIKIKIKKNVQWQNLMIIILFEHTHVPET